MRERKGHLVAIVGPDGVGKTTLARNLLETWNGPKGYVHFRPPMLKRLSSSPPERDIPPPPKAQGQGYVAAGWLRLAYNLALFWSGYLVRVRPVLMRDGLVVADRWAYGYLVQPRALRYYGPMELARSALKLFPQPSLVVIAHAPVETIIRRKGELSPEEVNQELVEWDAIPFRKTIRIDTSVDPAIAALEVQQRLIGGTL